MPRVRITVPDALHDDVRLKLQYFLDDDCIEGTAGTSCEPLIAMFLSFLDGLSTEKIV